MLHVRFCERKRSPFSMPSKIVLDTAERPRTLISSVTQTDAALFPEDRESLFEHAAWFYAFCREKLFRDDTERIRRALWGSKEPEPGSKLIEIACGPGFYARRFAHRYPQVSVVGVDRSHEQISWARGRARHDRLPNCRFERINVLDIPYSDGAFDALIASRLFTVLAEREAAVSEMHRILRPGGRCLIAEPRLAFRASVPLLAMWLLARVKRSSKGYCEPRRAVVLSQMDFHDLFRTQPWRKCEIWQDRRYQYALCEKE